jgi:alcohol dehydrogenase (cytochrome c)
VGVLAAAALLLRSVAAAEPQDASSLAAVKCREMGRPLGLSPADIDDALQHATPAQLPDLLKFCLQELSAYPSRSVDPAAVERGRIVYTTYSCASCHGKDTRGGEGGPSLLRSQRVMRDQKGETIGEVVLKGVPNTAMAAFPLKPSELADLAEFLHSFQINSGDPARRSVASIVTGNAAAGKRYFDSKCANCHSIAADLKGVGAKYQDPRLLQQTWLMPKNASPATATVGAPDSSMVDGQILHIDEFLVTLGLPDGTQRTFERVGDQPKLVIRDPLAGHKALLPTYSDRDIHDVTAYLVTLRQSPQHVYAALATPGPRSEHVVSTLAAAQMPSGAGGLSPEDILHPTLGSWPTYSGDYSGRRYSALKQIDQSNVRYLTLAWTTRLTAGPNDKGWHPLIVRGDGKGNLVTSTGTDIRASILEVNGVLYLSIPDNAWAVDARDGHVLWHFNWRSRGGWHAFGNRGLGMWGNYLYLETPDDYLISLDARTGTERWHVEIANFEEEYFASPAPIVVGNHVLVGAGNTLNAPGFLQSFDPDTGKLQWKHYSVPMNPGDPGLETWKDLDAARHGGGQVWVPGAYDPETHLYIYGTGNPTPAYIAALRGNSDALFTCSMLAVNVETGKMAWYYQNSPNDTHDWDSAQTPVLADITISGRPRKVAMTAARNGYFFVVDRATGEHLVTSRFSNTTNWAERRLNAKGQPVRIPKKDNDVSGALVSSANQGAANWPPASYSPDYELFYVPVAESWAMYYKTEIDTGGAYSMEGKEELSVEADSYLKAIDPKTGKIIWSVRYPSRGTLANGILATAGRLLFSGDTGGNLVARDPANGYPLWHAHLGKVSNAPETYMLDGHQYILVAAGDMLYAFKIEGSASEPAADPSDQGTRTGSAGTRRDHSPSLKEP